MNGNFLKFKRRLQSIRVWKSVAAGLAAGLFVGGICLVLSKLTIVDFDPILSLPIGAAVFPVVFLVLWIAQRISERRLAQTLDSTFDLQEKVQTMIDFAEKRGGMIDLQRADTENTLANLPIKTLKAKRVWIYLLALFVGAASLAAGFAVEDRRDTVPPEEIVPFEVSAVQIAGIEELIRYVDTSEMEEPYKTELSTALSELLEELKHATTEPEMQVALASALTAITETTYASSSMTEILNALWNTEDSHLQAFAKVLNTGYWTNPDWGDFAEKYEAFRVSLETAHEASSDAPESEEPTDEEKKASLTWLLEQLPRTINSALLSSGISESDPLYAAVSRFANETGENAGEDSFFGLSALANQAEDLTYEELIEELDRAFASMTNEFYTVISVQKINTNVGEAVLRKLATLFSVPIPEFERPDFVKNGEGNSSTDNDSDQDDEKEPSGGGVGEGAVFGSNDLILNPLTGEYVEYGTLYSAYNTLMIEKLENDQYGYTEEQKKAIEKYFALLYGGFKNEEGQK